MMVTYRVRVHGLKNFPAKGSLLICSNHQSFFDPLVLGITCPRPVNYLARKNLLRFPVFGWFLRFNDTIPIDRDAHAFSGMKETLRRLKRGESVVMFPEGTRSIDGEFKPLKLGFCALARRSKSSLMPIGIDGAYQAYPRGKALPRLGQIHVVMGKPIPYQQYHHLTDQEMADLLESRIQTCFEIARNHWNRDQPI
jgi:1-acyl-sn-glycerol-3-phosphate acyltransferase